MFDSDFFRLITKRLRMLGFDSSDIPDRYLHSNSFKSTLCSYAIDKSVSTISSTHFEVVMSKSDYLNAILTDFYLGNVRVNKQIEHINTQLASDTQAAWTLVTTYYACFFICNDISRISGRFITNLSPDNLRYLSSLDDNGNVGLLKKDKPAAFTVNVEPGEMENEVKLMFANVGDKPHKAAWNNISGLLKQLDHLNKNPTTSFSLFKDIVKSTPDSKWILPSELRNEWNYTSPMYYDSIGNNNSKQFIYLMRNKNSYSWSKNNNLIANDENQVATLAYVFQLLKNTYDRIWKQLIDNN
ncbi:hypothetical protein C1S86_25655 [Vibrio parahaemolyticus]|nr:hypothetical protein C1S97_26475 [Vibrio parahaemolyticus]PMT78847.1 hypothetical protein C1S86_25655 [Vibrio parahaemolyticus]